MANLERPLPLAMVIWFESLEFMSLGYGYDMVLLPTSHPTNHDYELSQRGGSAAPVSPFPPGSYSQATACPA
jgi:hypothetical protein